MSEWKKVFKLKNDGHWREVSAVDLREGDIFIMYESNGEPVRFADGEAVGLAVTDAYLDEDRRFKVNAVSVKEVEKAYGLAKGGITH